MTTHTDLISKRLEWEAERAAKLDVRVVDLEQQVAALTRGRDALQDKLNAVVTVGIREREQLVAAQAREVKLQGKLFHFGRHHSNCGWQMNRPCNCGFDEALALPTDDSALMERLKQEYKRGYKAGITTGSMT